MDKLHLLMVKCLSCIVNLMVKSFRSQMSILENGFFQLLKVISGLFDEQTPTFILSNFVYAQKSYLNNISCSI